MLRRFAGLAAFLIGGLVAPAPVGAQPAAPRPVPVAQPALSQAPVAAMPTVAPSAPARHALVIGNSRYLQAPLRNPANDARAVAQRLRAAGFEVVEQLDAGRDDMHRSIREFAQTLGRTRGVGVFYYAGHGVQLNWRNFLVPVDARIRARADLQSQAVDLGLLLDQLGQARNAANLIILDACRDNPFGPDFRVDDKGLSQIDAPPGTLLAYATAPGNVADDGPDDNGLYTGSLLREMSTEGAAIEDVFKRVRLSVRRASRGAQIPWESTSLESDFAFVPSSVPRDAAREFDEDLARWMGLRSSSSVDELEAFIRHRPDGKFSELAQHRLDQLLAARRERGIRPQAPRGEACACGPAPQSAEAVGYRVGERYVYRRTDLARGTAREPLRLTVSRIQNDEVFYEDSPWVTDLFGNNVRDAEGRRWTPYQFFIPEYPVGKRWSAQFVATLPDGRAVSMRFALRVAGRERITLPAGTFDALRIEARGANLVNGALLERTAWVAPEKMRGFLALESVARVDGKVVDGERIELSEYAQAAPRRVSPAGYP